MIIYYRDPTVEVTSAAIQINEHVFSLDELEYVWHRQVKQDSRVRRRALGAGLPIGGFLAAVAAVCLVVAAALGDRAAAWPVLLPLVGVGLLVMLSGPLFEWLGNRIDHGHDRGAAINEIWVRWRGRELLLLRVADESRFGRIYRSIQRALEQQQP